MNTTTTALSVALLLATLSTGCVSVDAPPSFLVIDDRPHHTRMITADEAKFRIQEFDDDDQGNFDFWSRALRANFEEKRGYTRIESKEVQDSTGRKGLELVFETTTEGTPHRYLITLFVIERALSNKIRVAEYVATKEQFDLYVSEVRGAISKLRS